MLKGAVAITTPKKEAVRPEKGCTAYLFVVKYNCQKTLYNGDILQQ